MRSSTPAALYLVTEPGQKKFFEKPVCTCMPDMMPDKLSIPNCGCNPEAIAQRNKQELPLTTNLYTRNDHILRLLKIDSICCSMPDTVADAFMNCIGQIEQTWDDSILDIIHGLLLEK